MPCKECNDTGLQIAGTEYPGSDWDWSWEFCSCNEGKREKEEQHRALYTDIGGEAGEA